LSFSGVGDSYVTFFAKVKSLDGLSRRKILLAFLGNSCAISLALSRRASAAVHEKKNRNADVENKE